METSQSQLSYDALVIGSGPAGGTAALMLASHGWSVAIVERSVFPRRKVCGEFISASSLPLLSGLGLRERFDNLAGPEIRRVGLFARDVILEAPMPAASNPCGMWGRAVGREYLDLMLLETAVKAGATVFQPWTATAVHDCGSDWLCEIRHKTVRRQISARVVIAANGSWRRGPISNRRPATNRASDLLAFKAHFRDSDLAADLMPLLVFPGGYGGMVRSDAGRLSLSCCIRRDTLRKCRTHCPTRAAEAVLQHLQRSCRGLRHVLRDAKTEGVWLSGGPIRPGIRKCYLDGIFMVGNLAGEAHPVIAEGISMAMQSSWLLCRHLIAAQPQSANRQTLADIGRRYGVEWRRSFSLRMVAAAAIAQLTMRPSAVRLWLPLLGLFPNVLTIGAALSGKTNDLDTAVQVSRR